jgi:hypothetical protein
MDIYSTSSLEKTVFLYTEKYLSRTSDETLTITANLAAELNVYSVKNMPSL